MQTLNLGVLSGLLLALLPTDSGAAEKELSILGGAFVASGHRVSQSSGKVGGAGYRVLIENDGARVPLVVVGGTPYEMGWHLGHLLRSEMNHFIAPAAAAFKQRLQLTDENLREVWSSTAAYTDDRFEQELLGLAEGSGVRVDILQQIHCLPLLMPYSCSSIAAWGDATADGHLYQTRNLDWDLEAGAHNFPAIVVYLPLRGNAHVLPTFAGVIGANCGLSAAGLALSEMGDSPRREMPYELRAPHFTTWFRTLLYDAGSLTDALERFQGFPQTKRYHFVFGDGRADRRAVKIRAHHVEAPEERLRIWRDNDPGDELAPRVLPNVVYQDEERGAFPTLESEFGRLDADLLMQLCNQIPIKGGNVLNAVFDATALRVWVSYAGDGKEAYQRPYVFADLEALDGDGDGIPDLREGSADRDRDGLPDFLDP
jgi:isopenicillin-N N-acyltransferase like protein